jgi:N-(2-amino-2-carboxyethyl)-L-glutamate synthase
VSVISVPQAFNEDDLYVDLRSIFGQSLFLKCEGFNFAGSVKLKAAAEMVEAADRDGILAPGAVLVESSSGNLGVALSVIAASKGYQFLCVTDSRCNLSARLLMEALGSRVHIISEPDATGGFLGARIDYVRALCASDDRYVWLNQYTNPGNWQAHYRTTAPAINREFPQLGIPPDQIGRQDNFFDRGGTSLSAVKLAITLDRAVSLKELIRHPVLADLAELVESAGGPASS